jgi:hypothetical protein
MKTYRCLWCVSTENHYILYFAVDCRIRLRNSGQLPVESFGTAALTRVRAPNPAPEAVQNHLPRLRKRSTLRDERPCWRPLPIFRLVLLAGPRKAQGWCNCGGQPVRNVERGAELRKPAPPHLYGQHDSFNEPPHVADRRSGPARRLNRGAEAWLPERCVYFERIRSKFRRRSHIWWREI